MRGLGKWGQHQQAAAPGYEYFCFMALIGRDPRGAIAHFESWQRVYPRTVDDVPHAVAEDPEAVARPAAGSCREAIYQDMLDNAHAEAAKKDIDQVEVISYALFPNLLVSGADYFVQGSFLGGPANAPFSLTDVVTAHNGLTARALFLRLRERAAVRSGSYQLSITGFHIDINRLTI